MQTSRNPKVLNNALKYKLQPILDKIISLEELAEQYNTIVEDQKRQEANLKEEANSQFNKYSDKRDDLLENIDDAKENLTGLINNQLYNPNKATNGDEGDSSGTIEETNLITDKIVKAAAYGFVKEGVDYCMFGVTGKGLAISTDPGQDLEHEWRNPDNDTHPFPSYYVNDILFVDTNTAFISTNNGVVIYKFDTDTYIVYDTSCGLPSKEVFSIAKVTNNDETSVGYVAITSNGIAYSPTGERWTTIASTSTTGSTTLVCIAKSNYINTPQKKLFIGTSNGIYTLDADKLITNNVRSVAYVPSAITYLPNNYVYGLAYDSVIDKLACATTGGALVISNASKYFDGTVAIDKIDTVTFTSKSGLVGTSCYDAEFTVDDRLVLGTANGISITDNFAAFTSITRTKNNYDAEGKVLNSHICNRMVRKNKKLYTILHGLGLTEDVEI